MPKLNFPEVEVRTRLKNGVLYLFDPIRKRWFQNTPEEWVRQNLLLFLHFYHGYPLGLMEVEKQIKLFSTVKRVDIICNDNTFKPRLIVECKSPRIKINEVVFDQVIDYNMALNVEFLFISNGLKHFVIKFINGKTEFLKKIPDFDQLSGKSKK